MLTARTAVPDRVEGLESGADDYLTKPFAFRELMARIRALTRRKGDDRVEAAGLVMDLRRYRVEHDGRLIDLSPKEFALLEVLMRNKGRVVSRTQILDRVWGYESWPESDLVTVYVSYLRRKFRVSSVPLQIKNIRGVGYILEAA